MKKRIVSLLVVALTLGLLYLVLRKVGVDELVATLTGADPVYVLLAFVLAPATPLISVIKWQILIKAQGAEVSLWYLFKLYLVGYFFNNFLPSNVGGDVVRVYELGSRTKDPAGAMASVFMERLTGFIVLIIIAAVAFLGNATLADDIRVTLAMVAATVMFLGVLWVIADPRLLNLIEKTIKVPIVQKYVVKFRKFHNSLNAYKGDRRTLVLSFVWSLAFHLMVIINAYICALAFARPISFWGIASIIPVLAIIAMLPLTFNGVGVQEWGYVLLFAWLGLPGSVGLSTIILIRAKVLVMAIIGGLFYAGSKLQTTATAYQ